MMSFHLTTPTGIALAASVLLYFSYQRFLRRKQLPLPPGPPSLPLVGNVLNAPTELPWETYHKWSKEYDTDVVHLNIMGTSIVVLDTYEATIELFERRSSIYSSRPRLPMLSELLGFDWSFALMPYGERWRSHRRLMHQSFHEQASKEFHPQQVQANRKMLTRVLTSPHKYDEHFRSMVGDVVMSLTYGMDVKDEDDPYIRMAEVALDWFKEGSLPGKYLVDAFPILLHVPKWLPGAHFKREAAARREDVITVLEVPFIDAKAKLETSTARPSFVSARLQETDPDDSAAQELTKNVAAVIYASSADTTVSAMTTFILAMIQHPEVQRKAQQELDSVLGAGHLPTFSDEPFLPYVTAVVKETLRYKPVAPLALPHFVGVDDIYKTYRIPAGSTVFGNAWAILHDEAMYPDPESFLPERFLTQDGKINRAIRDPSTVAFGFGRRVCPGRHFAESSLWLTVASLLTVFDISKELDKDGKEVEPTGEYASALIFTPKPFKCTIKPRSLQAEESIRTNALNNL